MPYIRTPGEVRRKRMIVAGILALIAVAIPAILFAIQTYWMPLDLLFRHASWTGRRPRVGHARRVVPTAPAVPAP